MASCVLRNSLVSWSRNPLLGLNRPSLFTFKVCVARSFTCLTGFKSLCIRSVQHMSQCNMRSVSSLNTSLQVCASQSGSVFGLLKSKLPQDVILKPSFGISGVRFLPTLNQYRRGKAKTKKDIPKKIIPLKKRILLGPQRKGVCVKVFTRKPKKPNSGNRKCALLKLSDGRLITAYIPGEGAVLQEHGVVLFEGGRVQDCPGVKYKIIRRKYDMN